MFTNSKKNMSEKSQHHKYILDNRHNTVAGYLREHLPNSSVLRLVSAYFSIYGYELLQDELDEQKDVRFLFGDPGSVGELDPGEKAQKSFELTEFGLAPSNALQQKFLALRCMEWASQESIKIRSIAQSNFLHGKLYLTDEGDSGRAVVGSSNFTRRGLGEATSANIEINLAIDDQKICNMSPGGRFAYSNDGIYCNQKAFIMTGASLKFLCAVLNSIPITWVMRNTAVTTGMGLSQWDKFTVEAIPIPKIADIQQRPFIDLIDNILTIKTTNSYASIDSQETEIDRLVYKLYSFTDAEIEVIKCS